MGWSCTSAASKTMHRWMDECLKQTDTQNAFIENGERRFWENDRVEHADGAITGEVYSFDDARKVGTFRIEPNGDVTRGPQL